jgi:hypothetical protein
MEIKFFWNWAWLFNDSYYLEVVLRHEKDLILKVVLSFCY